MMLRIPADEIRSSLTGALKILLRNPKARFHFNPTKDGFLNSFRAIWLAFIPYMFALLSQRMLLMGEHELSLEGFPSGFFFSIKILGIVAEWLMIPLLLWLAADILNLKSQYRIYIIARNWAGIITAWMFFVPTIAHLAGLIPLGAMVFTQFMLLGVALVYGYRVARVMLEKPIGFCIAIIAADFFFGVFLGEALWSNIQSVIETAPV